METARYVVVPEFFDEAAALRAGFERLVGNPRAQDITRDGVWNYWYVPALYTYMRTLPKRVLPAEPLSRFESRLSQWAFERFGFTKVTTPILSMYVDGCEQQLHNDAGNGDCGFVYSLTNWGERRFEGGETILFRDSVSSVRGKPGAGSNFYEKIPAIFNQLLVFDDRVLHGVARVTGGMNPLDSRVVIHGHLRARDVVARARDGGDLDDAFGRPIPDLLRHLKELEREESLAHQGFFTVRASLAPDGALEGVNTLWFRVATHDGREAASDVLVQKVRSLLAAARFAPTQAGAEITLPVSFTPEGLRDPSR